MYILCIFNVSLQCNLILPCSKYMWKFPTLTTPEPPALEGGNRCHSYCSYYYYYYYYY